MHLIAGAPGDLRVGHETITAVVTTSNGNTHSNSKLKTIDL
jgi:hypothetical protein